MAEQEAIWHVIIEGKGRGPLTAAQVAEYNVQAIRDRTRREYARQSKIKGRGGWLRLHEAVIDPPPL